jgi:hypothetical protein
MLNFNGCCLLKKKAEMKLIKLLTLTQQNAKRDKMQSFRSMNSNYIREKVSFSRIQQVTKHNFLNL